MRLSSIQFAADCKKKKLRGLKNVGAQPSVWLPPKEDLMDNKELSAKVWSNIEKSKKKAAKFEDAVAVSFSLISEENEDIYVAVVDGKLEVMPFHYDAYGCEIEASADTVNKLFSGALSFDKALKDGLAVVKGGDVAKFMALECLVPSKKTAAKPADKKASAKKTPAKTAAKKAPAKAAAKPAAKKAAPAAKPAAKAEEKKTAPAAKPVVKTEEKKAAPAAAKTAAKPAASAAAKPAEKKAADVKPTVKK